MTTTRHCHPFTFIHNTFASAYQNLRSGKNQIQDTEALLSQPAAPRKSMSISPNRDNATKSKSGSNRAKRQGMVLPRSPVKAYFAAREYGIVSDRRVYAAPAHNASPTSHIAKKVHFQLPSIQCESSDLSNVLETYLGSFTVDDDLSTETQAQPLSLAANLTAALHRGITRADSDIGSDTGSDIIRKFPAVPTNRPNHSAPSTPSNPATQKPKSILKKTTQRKPKPKLPPLIIPPPTTPVPLAPTSQASNQSKRSFDTTQIDTQTIVQLASSILSTPSRGSSLPKKNSNATYLQNPVYPPPTRRGYPHRSQGPVQNSEFSSLYQAGTGYPSVRINSPELREFQMDYRKAAKKQAERSKEAERNSNMFRQLARMV